MPRSRELLALLKRIKALPGWHVIYRRGGHYLVINPEGARCFMPSTPSDRRAVLNARAHLRRLGADV
jgi:hypothetical protein